MADIVGGGFLGGNGARLFFPIELMEVVDSEEMVETLLLLK